MFQLWIEKTHSLKDCDRQRPGKRKKAKAASATMEGDGKGSKDSKEPTKDGTKATSCKLFISDEGCKHGAACESFHPRVSREESVRFNCGSKAHSLKDCDRQRPVKREKSEGCFGNDTGKCHCL
eukprot:5627977-Amphidinium_carterae.1